MTQLKCSPPLVTGGIVAARTYTRILDHPFCHSCGDVVTGQETTSVGTVYVNDKGLPEMQFARLCRECASGVENEISKLGRAWEE